MSPEKTIRTTNKFSKVSGYKLNIQKSVEFIYTNYEISEKEIKNTIPFTVASKTIKHLLLNLTKEVKILYTEDLKL